MHIIKSFIIAFSIYSKIPMPQFPWKEEDMKYMLCAFPWIGAVIGTCLYLWAMLCNHFEIGNITYVLIGTAIPLIITGGFHVDGFMDTMDAFHSYQPKEKKLEILKDSHIGAFAVIMLAFYGLLYMGAFAEVQEWNLLKIVCAGFFLTRCFSGIAVISFPPAKKEGSLNYFADNANKAAVRIILILQAIGSIGFMLCQSVFAGTMVVAVALCMFGYYYYRCKKELGGITGDTAGYFVLICEAGIMVAVAVISICGGL